MKRLNKYFDQVYCLYLDKRLNRHDYIKENVDHIAFIAGDGSLDIQYDHVDIKELPPKFKQSINYETWWKSPNAYNAWLCHHKILNIALQKGCETLLLLEDDIEFSEELDSALDDFEKIDKWDMFYFGCYNNGNSLAGPSDEVRIINGAGGFHGVALKRKVIEMLVMLPPIGPYDWICGQYFHQIYNCYCSYPTVINQADGYSYIENETFIKPSRFLL